MGGGGAIYFVWRHQTIWRVAAGNRRNFPADVDSHVTGSRTKWIGTAQGLSSGAADGGVFAHPARRNDEWCTQVGL